MTHNPTRDGLTRREALQVGAAAAACTATLPAAAGEFGEHLRIDASLPGETFTGELLVNPATSQCRAAAHKPLKVSPHQETNSAISDGDHVRHSPDGQHLAFIRRTSQAAQIVASNQDGQRRRTLWQAPANRVPLDLCFSPDGQKLAVTLLRLDILEDGQSAVSQGCELVVLRLGDQTVQRVDLPEADWLGEPRWLA